MQVSITRKASSAPTTPRQKAIRQSHKVPPATVISKSSLPPLCIQDLSLGAASATSYVVPVIPLEPKDPDEHPAKTVKTDASKQKLIRKTVAIWPSSKDFDKTIEFLWLVALHHVGGVSGLAKDDWIHICCCSVKTLFPNFNAEKTRKIAEMSFINQANSSVSLSLDKFGMMMRLMLVEWIQSILGETSHHKKIYHTDALIWITKNITEYTGCYSSDIWRREGVFMGFDVDAIRNASAHRLYQLDQVLYKPLPETFIVSHLSQSAHSRPGTSSLVNKLWEHRWASNPTEAFRGLWLKLLLSSSLQSLTRKRANTLQVDWDKKQVSILMDSVVFSQHTKSRGRNSVATGMLSYCLGGQFDPNKETEIVRTAALVEYLLCHAESDAFIYTVTQFLLGNWSQGVFDGYCRLRTMIHSIDTKTQANQATIPWLQCSLALKCLLEGWDTAANKQLLMALAINNIVSTHENAKQSSDAAANEEKFQIIVKPMSVEHDDVPAAELASSSAWNPSPAMFRAQHHSLKTLVLPTTVNPEISKLLATPSSQLYCDRHAFLAFVSQFLLPHWPIVHCCVFKKAVGRDFCRYLPLSRFPGVKKGLSSALMIVWIVHRLMKHLKKCREQLARAHREGVTSPLRRRPLYDTSAALASMTSATNETPMLTSPPPTLIASPPSSPKVVVPKSAEDNRMFRKLLQSSTTTTTTDKGPPATSRNRTNKKNKNMHVRPIFSAPAGTSDGVSSSRDESSPVRAVVSLLQALHVEPPQDGQKRWYRQISSTSAFLGEERKYSKRQLEEEHLTRPRTVGVSFLSWDRQFEWEAELLRELQPNEEETECATTLAPRFLGIDPSPSIEEVHSSGKTATAAVQYDAGDSMGNLETIIRVSNNAAKRTEEIMRGSAKAHSLYSPKGPENVQGSAMPHSYFAGRKKTLTTLGKSPRSPRVGTWLREQVVATQRKVNFVADVSRITGTQASIFDKDGTRLN